MLGLATAVWQLRGTWLWDVHETTEMAQLGPSRGDIVVHEITFTGDATLFGRACGGPLPLGFKHDKLPQFHQPIASSVLDNGRLIPWFARLLCSPSVRSLNPFRPKLFKLPGPELRRSTECRVRGRLRHPQRLMWLLGAPDKTALA
ncbi:hypothetical protein B0H67DRAFT_48232 [Lasiosphaeris hirsuta]|uniref:Uncharacterized protein n=1 Tax=Lasiosphaeris hirsuta TaxID=260670 RepID=A0AA40BAL2_9PEZI|nr:hypothetical protein B0H67DRAFT_48232 [Lasiosphaeris hirsuta]